MTRKLDYASSVTNVERTPGEIVIGIPPVSPWPLFVVLVLLIVLLSTGLFIRAFAAKYGVTFASSGLLLFEIVILLAVSRYTLRKAKRPAVIRISKDGLSCTAPSFFGDGCRTWSLAMIQHAEVAHGQSDYQCLWLVLEDDKDALFNAFYYRASDLEAAAQTINVVIDEVRLT